jgi:ribonuclease P protein component
MRLITLKRPAEFKRVRGGKRVAGPWFVIEAKARPAHAAGDAAAATAATARVGLTITKKLGGAVIRNRLRRRLKEAIRSFEAGTLAGGDDYVLVARDAAVSAPYATLRGELLGALDRLHRQPEPKGKAAARPAGGQRGHAAGARKPASGGAGGQGPASQN